MQYTRAVFQYGEPLSHRDRGVSVQPLVENRLPMRHRTDNGRRNQRIGRVRPLRRVAEPSNRRVGERTSEPFGELLGERMPMWGDIYPGDVFLDCARPEPKFQSLIGRLKTKRENPLSLAVRTRFNPS